LRSSGRVRERARSIGLEGILPPNDPRGRHLLELEDGHLELRLLGSRLSPLWIDFTARSGRSLLRQVLSRSRRVVDATAGLGRDAWELAGWGAEVWMAESNPAVALLLGDALERASADPQRRELAGRLHLRAARGEEVLAELRGWAELAYLDPMFPPRRGGLPGRELQILSSLVSPSAGEELLLTCQQLGYRRVAVKRPRVAPSLPGPRPSGAIHGKQVRYDLYGF
jgi:hypothetical protein